MISDAALSAALRRYWGYDSFRPLQENVVKSLLTGHDACVVMPTGGGKSLCYQLPAALLECGTVIVISPLIALMQDQVAQLTQMGIPAALLNSSQSPQQQERTMRRAVEGGYRLLYLSPERIARQGNIAWLKQVPISFFAIDEAHCISEWGHDFRPEYRQLSSLRVHFPDRPFAAFTASANQRVRHDIIDQLRMRDPDKYIASFHRPNLRYLVKQCDSRSQPDLLIAALRNFAGANAIVYAPTIAKVEETVDFLAVQKIAAIAYHGKMDNDTRRTNQERWMADEVPVLVGTIAFGLGINKAAVRAVIHLSLPKSIEQYYQEAGRAGRDGLAADCILLWQKRDAGLLAYFIEQLSEAAERNRAWERYNEIRAFAESRLCRHRQICSHFGEKTKWESCGACDVCGGEPEWLAAPVTKPARGRGKRPKHPRRSAQRPSFDTGESGEAFRLKRNYAVAPSVVEATSEVQPRGLGYRRPEQKASSGSGAAGPDTNLREHLREWRRNVAKEQGVPAFIVLHDTSLDELCRKRPGSLAALRTISGFGERKTELYGPQVLEALRQFGMGREQSKNP